jgi:type 1 glutamine amidotransferase
MTDDLQVLTVTRGHAYNRNAFAELLDSLPGVECIQAEQPAAQAQFAPARAPQWDAFLMYDMPGFEFHPDHTPPELFDPPEEYRRDFTELVDRGHGFVFVHHALASWPTWEEYGDIMGGRFRFLRDAEHADSGYRHDVVQQVTAVAPTHPVLAGLEQGFEIRDELYLADIHSGDIEPLLVTDAELTDDTVWSTWNAVLGRRDTNDGWTHPRGTGVVAWVRKHPRSRIVYLQFGDGPAAFSNPAFRRLLTNALTWASGRDHATNIAGATLEERA